MQNLIIIIMYQGAIMKKQKKQMMLKIQNSQRRRGEKNKSCKKPKQFKKLLKVIEQKAIQNLVFLTCLAVNELQKQQNVFCKGKSSVKLNGRNIIFTGEIEIIRFIINNRIFNMIHENTWIETVQVKITQQAQKAAMCPHLLFQSKFNTIKSFVEEIKQDQLQITEKEDFQIISFVQVIINYLSHKDAVKNETCYRNALISLDNILGVKSKYLKKEHISQKFINNLIFYFCKICENEEDSQKNFNFLLYPVLYLVAILIYTATDKQSSKFLIQKLFNKKFLSYLSSIQICPGNKIERYVAIILAFLSKNLNNSSLNPIIVKKLILSSLHLAICDKSQFHMIYSLRTIIDKQSLGLSQIKKYTVLEFCLQYMSKKDSEQQITMVLQILKHILKRHQILCYKLLQKGITVILQKTYKISSKATISVLQTIIPCLTTYQKVSLFNFHSEQIKLTKSVENLQIISFLMEYLPQRQIFQFLENDTLIYFISKCTEKLLIQEQKIVTVFWQIFLQTLSEKNECIACKVAYMLKNELQNRQNKRFEGLKIQSLLNKYMSKGDDQSQNHLS